MTTKENVLDVLKNNGDSFTSGAELAKKFGVSRNAVWKAIKQLQNDGFKIEAVTNKGYRISNDNDTLNEKDIADRLVAEYIGKKIFILKEVDSTNNYAKELAKKGEDDGTVVISDYQTAGKGRMGRAFISPIGTGLYISVLLRPKCDMASAQLLTSCTAVAVAEAIDNVCGTECKIKWVNDIFLNEKKICGILTEAAISFESGTLDYAIIGIGINVRSVKETFDSELLNIASSLEDETNVKIQRNALAAEVLNCLEKSFDNLESRTFIKQYKERSCTIGNRVVVVKGSMEREAYAEDIDDNAALVVRYDDGTIEALNSGEARQRKYTV